MKKKNITIIIILIILSVAVLFMVKSSEYIYHKYTWYSIKKEEEKRYKELIEKFKSNQILTYDELERIWIYYALVSKYDEGIKFLEQVKDFENYKSERYLIYFTLSGSYAAKVKENPRIKEKQVLVNKSEEYLNLGFNNTPDKALAYYLRAKSYENMGCMEKAKSDLQKAINIANSMDIIFFGRGMLLKKEKFIEIVTGDLERLRLLKENCILVK